MKRLFVLGFIFVATVQGAQAPMLEDKAKIEILNSYRKYLAAENKVLQAQAEKDKRMEELKVIVTKYSFKGYTLNLDTMTFEPLKEK